MKILLKGRQRGITTKLVEWVREDTNQRALIVHNEQTAKAVTDNFQLPKANVVSYGKIDTLRGTSKKYFALDEYQLFNNAKDKDIPTGTVYISITLD